MITFKKILAALVLPLALAAASAPATAGAGDTARADVGEAIFRHGVLASGAPLELDREGGMRTLGAGAACINCHQRSGLGTKEGNRIIPPITGRYLFHQHSGDAADLDLPYVEGLRLDEAMHPLALLAVGLYGETLPNQNGAPIRLVVPWKYGFKSIKSIVKITLTEKQPPTTWNITNAREYGFYSNVNPSVDHPRWSQASERRLGELFKKKTLMFNGYPEVASLYSGMDLRKNY